MRARCTVRIANLGALLVDDAAVPANQFETGDDRRVAEVLVRQELGLCEPPLAELRQGGRLGGMPICMRWRLTCWPIRCVRLLTINLPLSRDAADRASSCGAPALLAAATARCSRRSHSQNRGHRTNNRPCSGYECPHGRNGDPEFVRPSRRPRRTDLMWRTIIRRAGVGLGLQ